MKNTTELSAIAQPISASVGQHNEKVSKPVSNTGVEVVATRFGLGWFSFTFRRSEGVDAFPCVLQFAKSLTRFTSPHLEKTKAGVNGYHQARVYADGVILAWSLDRPDIFVSIPQSALDRLEPERLAKMLYWCAARPGFHITRLDVFFDDHGDLINPSQLEEALHQGNFPGRATQWSAVRSFGKDAIEGETIYIGSQHSDFRVRCYDKSLESQGKVDAIRLEYQLRADTAAAFFTALVFSDYREWSARAFSLLLDKFDFCLRAGKRNLKTKVRCDWWSAFVASAHSTPWRVESKSTRFLNTIAWMEKIFPIQLALMGELLGSVGFSDWIDAMVVDGQVHITEKHRALLRDMLSQMKTL